MAAADQRRNASGVCTFRPKPNFPHPANVRRRTTMYVTMGATTGMAKDSATIQFIGSKPPS